MNEKNGGGAKDVPIGFSLSLSMNEQAMEHYSRMTKEEREGWIAKARQVQSKAEMERLVNRLGENIR